MAQIYKNPLQQSDSLLDNVKPTRYLWKKTDGEDWEMYEKGNETPIVTLSRMNSGFPWTAYEGENESNFLLKDAPSDKISDIKKYLLENYQTIKSKYNEKQDLIRQRDELWGQFPDVTKEQIQKIIEIRNLLGDDEFYRGK